MPRDRDLVLGTLSALVAATLFGMLGPLSRFAADAGVAGVAFTAWRGALGVVFVAAVVVARRGVGSSLAAIAALTPRGKGALATAALMALALNTAMFTAFGRIPIALALMLFYTYPAGVVVIDVLLGHERITPTRLLALVLSSVGVVLVLAGGPGSTTGTPLDPLGIVLGLAAAACQVVFVTVSRSGYRSVPADAATGVILAVSAVGASLIAVVVGQAGGLLEPFGSTEAWAALVLAGVVAAGLSSVLFLNAIRRIGGTRTGILMLIEPVVGTVLAAALLGEAVGPVQVLGGALVLTGALVLQVRSDPGLEPVLEEAAGPAV